MIINDEKITINFSEKYKKMLKRNKLIKPFLFIPAFIALFLLGASIEFILLMIPLAVFLCLLSLWASFSSDGDLPVKVRINGKGIYAWKRNKKEEFIPWDTVNEFREMYDIKSNDYGIFYKKKKGYNISLLRKGYSEFALDNNAAQIAMAKFDEYKNKNKEITDYDSFTKKRMIKKK